MAEDKPKVWKHIGLYGHAVGTFTGEFFDFDFDFFFVVRPSLFVLIFLVLGGMAA